MRPSPRCTTINQYLNELAFVTAYAPADFPGTAGSKDTLESAFAELHISLDAIARWVEPHMPVSVGHSMLNHSYAHLANDELREGLAKLQELEQILDDIKAKRKPVLPAEAREPRFATFDGFHDFLLGEIDAMTPPRDSNDDRTGEALDELVRSFEVAGAEFKSFGVYGIAKDLLDEAHRAFEQGHRKECVGRLREFENIVGRFRSDLHA